MSDLTHLNAQGEAHMVDVGGKQPTRRVAVADGCIRMQAETLAALEAGNLKKGDALGTARLAGIMAAKRTWELVPLCHPVALTRVEVVLEPDASLPGVRCRATAETLDRTGVEMEALAAVQVALLTVYDMAKALDRGMVMEGIALISKSGGRSGDWERPPGG